MAKFVIEPHFRLQEWVADEKGHCDPTATPTITNASFRCAITQ